MEEEDGRDALIISELPLWIATERRWKRYSEARLLLLLLLLLLYILDEIELELRLSRFENLMDTRPVLLSSVSVLLRQNSWILSQ